MAKPTTVNEFFVQSLATDNTLTVKQQQIILAAVELFAAKGFDHTTTSDIATKAGVAEGTVYKRYKTKREILEEIMRRFVRDVVPQAAHEFVNDEWTNSHGGLHQFLVELIGNRVDFIVANFPFIKIMASEALSNAEMRNQVLSKIGVQAMGAILPHLQELRKQKQIVDWPDDMLIQFVVATMISLALRLIVDLPVADIEQQKAYMVSFLERGLAVQK